jgi:hypothetical protein
MRVALIEDGERQLILLDSDFGREPVSELLTGMGDCIIAFVEANRKTKVVLLLLQRTRSLVLPKIG